MKHYHPTPAETGGILLPEGLLALAEEMARNTHEVWAAGRLAEGWTWGPVRDDALKQHPCLVPYDELPEEEKDYDRRTSQETLRFILSFGYEIRCPGEEL